jgi:hypothetical protein
MLFQGRDEFGQVLVALGAPEGMLAATSNAAASERITIFPSRQCMIRRVQLAVPALIRIWYWVRQLVPNAARVRENWLSVALIFHHGQGSFPHRPCSRRATFRLSVQIRKCLKGLTLQSLGDAPLPGDCTPFQAKPPAAKPAPPRQVPSRRFTPRTGHNTFSGQHRQKRLGRGLDVS